MKPMLATDAVIEQLEYPLLASPKLDGIRCVVHNNEALTRTLKKVPNKAVFETLSRKQFNHMDGELIVGEPTSKTVYRDTVSGVMSIEGKPDFRFFVFDHRSSLEKSYEWRRAALQEQVAKIKSMAVQLLQHDLIQNFDALLAYEERQLDLGYEGIILRKPRSPYKCGRSTMKEGYLLKMKRFTDSEAVIVGFEEEMHNTNEAKTNELGRTQRSSAKAGLVGKATLGALVVKQGNIEFRIGTGFDAALRLEIWKNQDKWIGKTIKFKYFAVGMKDLPRHPTYLGERLE